MYNPVMHLTESKCFGNSVFTGVKLHGYNGFWVYIPNKVGVSLIKRGNLTMSINN